MAKTREIKKRIKAVGNIKRITKTMQMIATAKFAASQQRAVAGRPYTETLFDLVTQLAGSMGSGDAAHPLLDAGARQENAAAKELTLIITSDRGLCGPYNSAVLRTCMTFLRSNPAAKGGLVELVGKKGVGFMKFAGVPVARNHSQFGDKPRYEDVQALAEDYTKRFIAGEVSRVRVVYMKFLSPSRQTPQVVQLLPFQTQAADKKSADNAGANQIYEFSPDAKELLDALLPAAVKALLFQAFNDAVVSENVARMVAMKSATDAAGKMGKLYTRKFNRARQAQITTELTEIISGAAALE
ncbi:MAG TPA: ATP synthase F1 subunit gamma [Phycisphaerales bacterium]|nr:ATP synthase F1 subunit gamma [Phycisphaerales bacterium]